MSRRKAAAVSSTCSRVGRQHIRRSPPLDAIAPCPVPCLAELRRAGAMDGDGAGARFDFADAGEEVGVVVAEQRHDWRLGAVGHVQHAAVERDRHIARGDHLAQLMQACAAGQVQEPVVPDPEVEDALRRTAETQSPDPVPRPSAGEPHCCPEPCRWVEAVRCLAARWPFRFRSGRSKRIPQGR